MKITKAPIEKVLEAMNDVRTYIEKRYNTKVDYPLSGLGVAVGFFFVWFIELVVLKYKHRSANNIKQNNIDEVLDGSGKRNHLRKAISTMYQSSNQILTN